MFCSSLLIQLLYQALSLLVHHHPIEETKGADVWRQKRNRQSRSSRASNWVHWLQCEYPSKHKRSGVWPSSSFAGTKQLKRLPELLTICTEHWLWIWSIRAKRTILVFRLWRRRSICIWSSCSTTPVQPECAAACLLLCFWSLPKRSDARCFCLLGLWY